MEKDEQWRRRMTDMPKNRRHLCVMQFRITDHMLRRVLERRVAGTGVHRSQHQILMHLFFKPDYTQAGLAEHMEVSPAAVAVSIKKLERGGYVSRENKEGDGRSNRIVITAAGEKVVRKSIEIFHEIDEVLFHGFSEEQVMEMEGCLKRMYDNLTTYVEGLEMNGLDGKGAEKL